MNDMATSRLIAVPILVENDKPPTTVEAEAEAEAEIKNRDGKFGSGAVPTVPLDAPVLRAHYKLQEVLGSDRILGRRYRRSIIDSVSVSPVDRSGGVRGKGVVPGGSYINLISSPGVWNQVLRCSLHPSRTALSVDLAPLARRVSSLPRATHLNAELSSKNVASEMANLSPLSDMVCNLSMDSKVVLPMVREALEIPS